jgi:DNA modification methylase
MDNLDPLRHIEGFPLGKDEDLHALSNPPYYTAYPNPHIADFIKKYGKPYDETSDDYHREPFVADVSEGKNDPIYNAHSYHTKVPYKALIPFINHYIKSGEIVFDGFAGSGMTGLAAQATGRHAILCDLAPAATFIASNFNKFPAISIEQFSKNARSILEDAIRECTWMFETHHKDGKKGIINYSIWSEVFECPYCKSEIIFSEIGYDFISDSFIENPICTVCKADITKNELIRQLDENGKTKLIPVLIDYSIGKKRYKKKPDEKDLILLDEIINKSIPYWYPNELMMFKEGNWGDYWRSGYHTGYKRISDFYTKRSLWSLAYMWDRANKTDNPQIMRFLITSFLAMRCSLRMPYRAGGKSAGAINNLHIPSLIQEYNPLGVLKRKTIDFLRAIEAKPATSEIQITTQSVCDLIQIPDNTIDYIFVDPPFGNNIIYGELNFLWESWLRVFSNIKDEAIVSQYYKKGEAKYRDLMLKAFTEMYRVIKPGRWITVEFHNSKASIWNIIQDSLARSGFLVAQVTILDKQQGSYKQVSAPGSVKNDLIINAYKPRLRIVHPTPHIASRAWPGNRFRARALAPTIPLQPTPNAARKCSIPNILHITFNTATR